MGKITALRAGRGRGKRVNVFLAAKEGLRIRQELSEDRIKALAQSDSYQRCYNAALLYLSYRPRSEPELRERLHKRGFDDDSTAKVITRLREQGLVDDAAFARFWTENRDYFRPRSQRLTRLELKRKGVDEEIIDRVVGEIDDEDSARRAAMKKVRSLAGADYQSFRRRLGDYLKRRGFGYGVITRTVEQLWQERNEQVNTEN